MGVPVASRVVKEAYLATVGTEEPLAVAVVEAIRTGDLPVLRRLLTEHPWLATARIGDDPRGMSRTLLHVVTDWPGHFPNGAATVKLLVERGAGTTIVDAATLGLLDHLERSFTAPTQPTPEAVNAAFWGACHGGQQPCAAWLLDRGAELNWTPPWEDLTPLDAARRSGAGELVGWLRDRGASSATELHPS